MKQCMKLTTAEPEETVDSTMSTGSQSRSRMRFMIEKMYMYVKQNFRFYF